MKKKPTQKNEIKNPLGYKLFHKIAEGKKFKFVDGGMFVESGERRKARPIKNKQKIEAELDEYPYLDIVSVDGVTPVEFRMNNGKMVSDGYTVEEVRDDIAKIVGGEFLYDLREVGGSWEFKLGEPSNDDTSNTSNTSSDDKIKFALGDGNDRILFTDGTMMSNVIDNINGVGEIGESVMGGEYNYTWELLNRDTIKGSSKLSDTLESLIGYIDHNYEGFVVGGLQSVYDYYGYVNEYAELTKDDIEHFEAEDDILKIDGVDGVRIDMEAEDITISTFGPTEDVLKYTNKVESVLRDFGIINLGDWSLNENPSGGADPGYTAPFELDLKKSTESNTGNSKIDTFAKRVDSDIYKNTGIEKHELNVDADGNGTVKIFSGYLDATDVLRDVEKTLMHFGVSKILPWETNEETIDDDVTEYNVIFEIDEDVLV